MAASKPGYLRPVGEWNFEEVTVKVGKMVHSYKRFHGRLLAKGRLKSDDELRELSYSVYETQKGKFAVYVRDSPNWNYYSDPKRWQRDERSERDRQRHSDYRSHRWSYRGHGDDWSPWPTNEYDYRLEVYEALDQLKENVPHELYEAVVQAVNGDPDGAEFLDI